MVINIPKYYRYINNFDIFEVQKSYINYITYINDTSVNMFELGNNIV